MNVGLRFGYKKNSLGGGFYASFIREFVGFEPDFFLNIDRRVTWDRKKHMPIIENASIGQKISVSDKEGNIFSTSNTLMTYSHQTVVIEQRKEISHFLNTEIEDVILSSSDFLTAYIYNEEYESVQYNKSESVYRHRNIPVEILDSVKHTPYRLGVFNDKVYDTKFNPGRSILLNHIWLMIGWKMWFGNDAFKIISKERILSFPYAVEIKELSDSVVYVQLYDKLEEPYTPESVFRQWKWREWLDYEKLEEQYG